MIRILSLLLFFVVFIFNINSQTIILTPTNYNTIYGSGVALDPGLSNGAGDLILVGKNGSRSGNPHPNGDKRALLKFDISGIPTNATITDVTLTMNMNKTHSSVGTIANNLHLLTSDWGQGNSSAPGNEGKGASSLINDANWLCSFSDGGGNCNTSWTTDGGDFNSTPSASTNVAGVGAYLWSSSQMINDVQDWLDGTTSNFGWIVIGDETTISIKKYNATGSNAPSLRVTYTTPGPSFNTQVLTECNGFNITINGNVYDSTGIYVDTLSGQAANGMDSILTTDLTILPPVDVSIISSGLIITSNNSSADSYQWINCDGDTIIPGETAITYTANAMGTFSVIITEGNCVDTSSCTLIAPGIVTQMLTECDGFSITINGNVYDSTGIYVDTLFGQAVNGMDSILTTHLTILPPVDVSTTVINNIITGTSVNATSYLWIDCNNNDSLIAGQTNSSFQPTENGSYAVIVTENTCTDTSACVNLTNVSILDERIDQTVLVYPNPTLDKVNIVLNAIPKYATLTLKNILGETISRNYYRPSKKQISLNIPGKTGIYFIELITDSESKQIFKILKE